MDTKVISFFSYKGGAGRSTLAYNIIPILAEEHIRPSKASPIIVVDMDIDSCGMSYLLEVEKQVTDENCVQYLLSKGCGNERAPSISEDPFFSKLLPVGNKFGYADNNAVLFLPAKDVKNVDGSSSSNYNDANNPFRRGLEQLVSASEKFNVPAIILDSAVGNNATANASNQVADVVVCCMRPTKQFVNGTVRFFETLNSAESPWGKKPRKIILVPNVVPQEEMVIDDFWYPGVAVDAIINEAALLAEKNSRTGNFYVRDMLGRSEFGIPALTSFMWREAQLYTMKELSEPEKLVLERYRKLSAIINEA